MRAPVLLFVLLLTACSEEKAPPPKFPWRAAAPEPKNETLKFPASDQVSVSVVEDKILGYDFLPGGNLGLYRKGAKEYKLFLVKLGDFVAPANALLEFKNRMADAKFVPNFGGYAGTHQGVPTFVFTKSQYVLGIVGLTAEEADPVARQFAGRVP